MNKRYMSLVFKWAMFLLISGFFTSVVIAGLYFIYRMTSSNGYVNVFDRIAVSFAEVVSFYSDQFFSLVFILFFVGILFSFLIISHRYICYFVKLEKDLDRMANGQLTQRLEVKDNHEFGQLARQVNQLVEKLEKTVYEERVAEQSKTELITNVSHDLRTPLTSIMGYLDLIERDQYKDEVTLRYYTDIAYEKTKQMNTMVNDLFEYIRTNNPKLILNKAHIDLKEVINQLASHFYLQMNDAKLNLRLHLPDEEVKQLVDGEKLSRVFENIISNAIKYGSDAPFIDLTLSCDSKGSVIEVRNYGEPIAQSELPFIFERFYRVDQSRSKDTGGSGLGLAIAKNIVELHGGSIRVTSDQAGTAFTVTLPIEKAPKD
ncbi:sensor histidine kinase [Alkalicoccobacillus murimartini]|uniref:histidine kinase n=1 Tax=Alkalicoccobacillus murimartini TaxID=171685 RepID=A0ABT9YKC9_9BACI|nr:HAMP domain-containing sensor histidine kinase [Alkalicoccobacillus murimartini]MDQ0207479.1 signal transduction histidine kinase [Alkalicoccobacillus murimartini]